jgi:predicted P-loop ATPase
MRECIEHGKHQPITYERWLQNRADFFAGTGQQSPTADGSTADAGKESGTDAKSDDFKEQSSFGKAVKLIQDHFDVHYNLVRARPEIRLRKPFPNAPDCFTEKFTPVGNREKQSLRVWLKTQGVNASKDSVEMILESHLCPRWNPFFDFYDNLPIWDGIDRITQYADTVRTTSQPYWRKFFRKWLCSMVAAWKYDNVVNHSVIVLVGRKQGTGKTRWIGDILPPELADYYALLAHIDTADRYMKILLSEKGLVNLDDFEELTRKEHGKLKSFITQPQIASRRNYGENEDFIHRASIAGSTNQRYFLSDMSGSRRWIVVELVESDENPISEKDARAIDKSQLYAQCRHIIESGETYYVASSDFEEIETHNAQFKLASPEEELVALNFRKPDETETAEMLTASEIKSILEARYKTTLSDVGVGKVLSRLGFEQETKWKPDKGFTVRAYRVKRLGAVFETDFPKF